ncbi:MAG: cell surface protein SprA [Bacteroidetes bacterium]|nr:cell surface protein SprA [Bacteroidota bacterium]
MVTLVVSFIQAGTSSSDIFPGPDEKSLAAEPDTTNSGDTTKLPFPFHDDSGYPYLDKGNTNGLYLNPTSVKKEVEYDRDNNQYIINSKIGNVNYRDPVPMSFKEYLDYDLDNSLDSYWRQRARTAGATKRTGFLPQIHIGGEIFDRIFGTSTIDIRPQGSAELIFGVLHNRRDDPALSVRQRRTTNFDFEEKIQMNVVAKIGDKIEFNTNYNTEATFDFENKLKLRYEGKEDEIVKLIEAGDVTLPLTSTLITGSQSLFGIKTQLQFGKATVTAVYSEQKSQTSSVRVEGGAQTTPYNIRADEYEENRHFFLAQYFRDHYEQGLAQLPIISSAINITKIEVWVTNIGPAVEENRNIVAFSDLAEVTPFNPNINTLPGAGNYPSTLSNDLVLQLDPAQIRDINMVSNYLNNHQAHFVSGVDYEKVESARKLRPIEYSFNSKLGFISLNTSLNTDQVLAVAFQYTVIGIDSVFQVGELSDEGITPPGCLVVKLLKSTAVNTMIPMWNLMMKNVYSIDAYQINPQDFILNILYSGNDNGVPTGYLTEGPPAVKGIPLIQVLNFDNLDPFLNPPNDGLFDFIDNASTRGGTIQSNNGRVYFTVLEPFGSYLRRKFGDNTQLADKYCYDSLYTLTKFGAQQYPEKNKYLIQGMYKSASGSEISLNAINVPQGSVRVTAGGVPLTENIDYTVDYTLGRVRIINEGILNSGTPINISLENNSMFQIQTQRLVGAHIDYVFNKNLSIGGTVLNLRERPLTQKTNYGEAPISNTMLGLEMNYQKEIPFITKLVDALPFYSTKAPSTVTIMGEVAQFLPGHSKAIGKTGTSYIDDFEASKSTIDLKNYSTWFLASTPQDPSLFPEGLVSGNLAYGANRAKLSWYIIDPLFYQKSGTLKPKNISKDELSNNYSRYIPESEVFPNIDPPNGQPMNLAVFNLAFYPSERGPYNYDVEPTPFSEGMSEDGTLNTPGSRWGGIMRQIETTDFESTNVEYIEFWLMDPFADGTLNSGRGGKLYFHLGDISEDILKDSRKSYENGLPVSAQVQNVDTTVWGRVPTLQALVNSFDNTQGSRQYQDIGYDGLSTEEERSFFEDTYLNRIVNYFNGTNNSAYANAFIDPSGDDYHYFRGTDYDDDPTYSNILERYKQFNNPEKNSPSDEQNPETYPTSYTQLPNVEDINNDNTLSEAERYFEYEIDLDTAHMKIGQNYIADMRVAQNIPLENGQKGEVTWYQFKIPVSNPERVVGNIQDFKSIRFMRMLCRDFQEPIILRFATLELVRGEWRRYKYDLLYPGEYIPNDNQNQTTFDISTVSFEENGSRAPIPYVIPPGIEREINIGTTNLQQINEQAMDYKICGLLDGDARAAYKTTDFDFRDYKHLRMFIHAEDADPAQTIQNGDLTLFVRLGTDFTENFYEYEMPLVFTPWYTTDPESIWPESNRMDIVLQTLVDAKMQRNEAMQQNAWMSASQPFITYDGNNKITIVGTPSISDIKAIMIGVRNPKKLNASDNDDGETKCAEIWINELRVTDFDDKAGWAATGRLSANLADLGNVIIGGLHSTPGFGSIDKKVNERQKETISQYDFATNIEVGKFFPPTWGVRIPMHFDYSQTLSNPQYNPLDPDVLYKDELKYLDKNGKDSLKARSQEVTRRKNLNFINVRKERLGATTKPYPWNIENFNFTYAYQEIYQRSEDIEYDKQKKYRGGLGYTFSLSPKNVSPFAGLGFLKSKAFTLIRDFNFYYLPKLFSFRTEMNRQYNERKLRNKSTVLIIIQPTYLKKWDWIRAWDLKYDLTKGLKIDYTATGNAFISEPPGIIDKNSADWGAYKDSIWSEVRGFGTMGLFNQNFDLNYNIPINKFPYLDWINATLRYGSTYRWRAAPLSIQPIMGNTIENNQNVDINGGIRLSTIYNKIGYLKKLGQPSNQKGKKEPPNKAKTGKTAQQVADSIQADTAKAKPRVNYFKLFGDGLVRILICVKDITVTYSENNGMILPGFKPEPNFLGMRWNDMAPGWGFVFGLQNDIRNTAVKNGWLTTDTLLNNPYITRATKDLTYRANIEPFRDFRIEITGNWSKSLTHEEYFKAGPDGIFRPFSPVDRGTFTMSYWMWKSAFVNDEVGNISPTFQKFLDNRKEIAFRLARDNPNWNGAVTDSTGFPVGYGPSSVQVLAPSFMAAFSNISTDKIFLSPFPNIPYPNWRLTYNGLNKVEFFKKLLKNINITHAYRSVYSISSFVSNLDYRENLQYPDNPSAFDKSGNYIAQYRIDLISITEQFAPLINIDMTWYNSLLTRVEFNRSRNLSLSFVNNQLTEVSSNEFIIGVGYRFKDVQFNVTSIGGGGKKTRIKSDLNIKLDFSVKNNKTILRRIDEVYNLISSGQRVFSINASADYMINQKLNVRFFFDQTVNNPYTSNQFKNSTTRGGISLRFTLAQ